ncbi:hypothetical protein CDL12_10742 [Handroanthus impetiginosus]|uniref:Transposase MuDR plant domain-containing protein n=1 Tax=Handroanthus impetiginosus TaxID=429701 RepID=A0A2G9HGP4_9LAMI|nr:hypothetical protein CDL12_10742 [Handroanthus impetiginosus]
MRVGGRLDHTDGVKYVGGVKYYYENIDLDRFWFEDLYSLYGMSGGTCTNVNFYYTPPGHPLDLYSLRLINCMTHFAILEMIQGYKGVQIPISIYVEELDDPLLVLDPKGNILPNKMHDYVQAHEPSDDSTDFDKEGTSDVGKHANHAYESDGGETDSDSPSIMLEDLETSSDEDIFLDKNLSKSQLVKKLKKILSNKHTKMQLERDTNEVQVEEWYSDIRDENELHSLSEHSDEEDATCKHPYFKEGQNMKNFRLTVGMKFRNAAVFREALRDNCVRHGYDLDYIKNENARITAKCKNEGCTWRMHASPIIGGPTFK